MYLEKDLFIEVIAIVFITNNGFNYSSHTV